MGYEYAPEVRDIAEKLIQDYHKDLLGHRVEYIWREKAVVRAGKVTLGKAKKISGLNAFLASGEPLAGDDDDQSFFVIEIARDAWGGLTEEEKIALIDHELEHCIVDEEGKTSIQPHDLEDFLVVYRRHGAWSEALQRFAVAKGKDETLSEMSFD